LAPPDVDRGLRHFQQKPRAVFDRAAIAVGAQIAARLQELLDQITVGAVDFDAVETGRERVARGLLVGFDNRGDFIGLERARRFIRHNLAVGGRGLEIIGDRNSRGRDRQRAAGLERGMRDAADMPELEENDRALGVDGIDDLLPAFDLRLAVNAGNIGMTETARHDGGSFRYQKPAWGRAARNIPHSAAAARATASPRGAASTAPVRRDA
jgi:hypothetical protein